MADMIEIGVQAQVNNAIVLLNPSHYIMSTTKFVSLSRGAPFLSVAFHMPCTNSICPSFAMLTMAPVSFFSHGAFCCDTWFDPEARSWKCWQVLSNIVNMLPYCHFWSRSKSQSSEFEHALHIGEVCSTKVSRPMKSHEGSVVYNDL